jgi:hypothetical protein
LGTGEKKIDKTTLSANVKFFKRHRLFSVTIWVLACPCFLRQICYSIENEA